MNDIQFPEWYLSSQGPGISKTIINIVGNIVPVLNLILASRGIHFIPSENWNTYISIGVFLYFSIQAIRGYVQSKNVLIGKVKRLQDVVNKDRV